MLARNKTKKNVTLKKEKEATKLIENERYLFNNCQIDRLYDQRTFNGRRERERLTVFMCDDNKSQCGQCGGNYSQPENG